MHRVVFLIAFMSALLGLIENAQSQSRRIQIEPIVQPQLGLGSPEAVETEAQDDSLELSEPASQDDVGPSEMSDDDDSELDDNLDAEMSDEDDLELDDDLDTEQDPASLRRVTDEQIRNNWPKHSIEEIGLSLHEVGRVPEDRSGLLKEYGRFGPVSESVKVFAWEAPDIRYQPLFFEDVALERYGQTLPDYRQSVRSAIHFGTAFTGLSLQLLETPSRSCDYSLGYCRPGSYVPQTTQRHFFGPLSLQ